MAGRHYLRDQDAEEPEDFIVALTSQVLHFPPITCYRLPLCVTCSGAKEQRN